MQIVLCVNRPGFVISDWPRLFHDANLLSGTTENRGSGLKLLLYFIMFHKLILPKIIQLTTLLFL